MLIGPRAASYPIQIVALLLGIVEGVVLHYTVVGAALFVLPEGFNTPLLVLSIAFCAYFLAAPTTWRGLARRALLILAISLLGYAVLGYLIAFLVLRGTPIPMSMPSLILSVQAAILAIGIAALIGYLLLRDRKERDFLDSATVPAPENAVSPGATSDQQR